MLKFLTLALTTTLSVAFTSCRQAHRYSGHVVEKFRTDAGYKSSPHAFIVFYSDSLRRNVALDNVSWNTWVNLKPGDPVTFILYDYQLAQ